MAYENKGQVISLKSTAATKKYTVVKVTGDNTFAAAAAGDVAVGILQNDVVAGEAGGVMVGGVSFAKAVGAIAAGAEVTAGADGTVATAVAGNDVVGIALQGGVANDIISVLIRTGKKA